MNASTASEIRSKARKALFVPGKGFLYLFPVLLYLISPLFLFVNISIVVDIFRHQFSPVPIILWALGLLSLCILMSANFAILDGLRGYRDKVKMSDNGIIFSKEIFGKFLFTALLKWLYLILWLCPSGIAILIFIFKIKYGIYGPKILDFIVAIIFYALLFGGIMLSIIKSFSYSMTYYVLYDQIRNGTYTNPNDVIRKSKELMHGNKWRYFCLQLSFIGWNILASIFWMIMNFYVLPYRQAAQLVFYDELLNLKKNN